MSKQPEGCPYHGGEGHICKWTVERFKENIKVSIDEENRSVVKLEYSVLKRAQQNFLDGLSLDNFVDKEAEQLSAVQDIVHKWWQRVS